MEYPVGRDLDGIYFRVNRNGKWRSICFSDLTAEEKQSVMDRRDSEWLQRLAVHLADVLREIGDEFDIRRE